MRQEAFAALGPEIVVVVAYGLILPRGVLQAPARGCLNIHASLLPRWRGAAPIQRAVMAGDAETGVSIMRMEAGLDTGPVLLREVVPIGARDTGGSLHDRLAAVGARLIVEALGGLDGLAADTDEITLTVRGCRNARGPRHEIAMRRYPGAYRGVARVVKPQLRPGRLESDDPSLGRIGTRPVFFSELDGFSEVAIFRRERLRPGNRVPGPAIIEATDTTVVVHPLQSARVDEWGNLVFEQA